MTIFVVHGLGLMLYSCLCALSLSWIARDVFINVDIACEISNRHV